MSQVTVTDVKDVTKMTKSEILKWIDAHLHHLFVNIFTGYKDPYRSAVINDIKNLRREYRKR